MPARSGKVSEEEAEIVRRASEHMRTAHDGMEVRESTVEQIKSRIHEAEASS